MKAHGFGKGTGPTLDVLSRLSGKKTAQSTPECKVTFEDLMTEPYNEMSHESVPKIEVDYEHGGSQVFMTEGIHAGDILNLLEEFKDPKKVQGETIEVDDDDSWFETAEKLFKEEKEAKAAFKAKKKSVFGWHEPLPGATK